MKRVAALLVQPKTPTTYWSMDSAVKSWGFKAVMPPLGLMTIAAMLPSHYDVTILDLNARELDASLFEKADVVFVTGMWIHREGFIEIVRLAKRLGKTVVAGGPFVQSAYTAVARGEEDYMASDNIDHLVLNEAEITLPQFLADYEEGKAKKVYTSKERPNLSQTPSPRFDLVNPNDYGSMSLQFSRGCPFSCEFCDIIQMFGRVPRTKSPDQFMQEIENLYATGYRGHLFIVDDNFIANRNIVKELLRKMVSWQQARQYPYLLFTEASVDLAADPELLDLMAKAGFVSVFLGIESPDPNTLRATKKKQNVRCDMDASVRKIQEAGIEVMGGFILGFDTDTPDIFDRQISFIQRNGIAQSMVGILAAMPNTDLYTRLEKEGRIIDLKEKQTGDNVDATLNFVPIMPADDLTRGYKRVVSESYDPKKYFERALALISRLPNLRLRDFFKAPPWKRSIQIARFRRSPSHLRITVEIVKLAFSRWGLHALPFFVRALRHGIFALPVAIDLAFRGRHYAAVAEKIVSMQTPATAKALAPSSTAAVAAA